MSPKDIEPSPCAASEELLLDRLYRNYGEEQRGATPGPKPTQQPRPYLTRLVNRHFPTDLQAAILDLGCGEGDLVRVAAELGYWKVEGVDRSASQVRAARTAGIGNISEGDALSHLKGMATGSMDVLVAMDLLEHLSRTEVLELLDEARRVLKTSGRFLAHVPNGASPFAGRVRYGDFTHVQAFTAGSIRQVFLAAGFSRVHCHEDRPVVHGFRSAVRAAAWQVVRGCLWAAIAVESGPPRGEILSQNLLAVAFVK